MTNQNNLIPFTERDPENATKIRRQGGITSGKIRRQQADLRKAFQTLLSSGRASKSPEWGYESF